MKRKQSDEFEQFDKVVRGLLTVPYSELQRQLDEEKRTKDTHKKKRATSPASRASSSPKKQVD